MHAVEGAIARIAGGEALYRELVHGYLVDVYWPAERLAVEFDGYRAHGHRLAFHSNRKRDQVLLAHGVRTLRVTDRHLTNEPMALITRIAQSLRA